jgi:hypothetical protein
MDTKKLYQSVAYLIKQHRRATAFYLPMTDKEYHLLSDGDIVIMLSLEREASDYEISTMNFTGSWVDLELNALMATEGGMDYDLMWRHLKYFNITPDKIYDLYSSASFVYEPHYDTE